MLRSSNSSYAEIARRSRQLITEWGQIIDKRKTGRFSRSVSEAIKERDDWRCYICGKDTDLHVHHIIPRSDGGPDIPENLVTLCSGCHRSVESGNVRTAVAKCVGRALKQSNR